MSQAPISKIYSSETKKSFTFLNLYQFGVNSLMSNIASITTTKYTRNSARYGEMSRIKLALDTQVAIFSGN